MAYIDPSAGGMLLQVIFGGVAGLFVLLKLQGKKLRSFLGSLFGRKNAPADAGPSPSNEPRH
jgi:hypothetical protein